jgi:hypothetical protein
VKSVAVIDSLERSAATIAVLAARLDAIDGARYPAMLVARFFGDETARRLLPVHDLTAIGAANFLLRIAFREFNPEP